jgi:hypothetical protein
MKAVIQRNQIRYYKEEDVDRLELGVRFTEHPDLPTYGLMLDVTGLTTEAELRPVITGALQDLQAKVEQQMAWNGAARQHFDTWGWSDTEFEIDNL